MFHFSKEITLQQIMAHLDSIRKDMVILEKSEFANLRAENEVLIHIFIKQFNCVFVAFYLLYIFVKQNMNVKVILDTLIRIEESVWYNFRDHIKICFTCQDLLRSSVKDSKMCTFFSSSVILVKDNC